MKRIVLIEDDELIANIYCNKLRVQNYEVEVALDGEHGLEMITRTPPDLVIMDLMVPKIPGVELLRMIRKRPELANVPVLVFSSTYLSSMIQDAWQAGATKCLSKANCSAGMVLKVVAELISSPPSTAHGSKAIAETLRTKVAAAPTEAKPESDDPSQAEMRQSVIKSLPASLQSLRATVQLLTRANDEAARLAQMRELFQKIRALTGNTGVAGLLMISQMSDALEALLKELCETPKNITPSSIRTVAHTIDFLGLLFERSHLPEALESAKLSEARVLVVDDEAISRRAVAHALEKAGLQSLSLENATEAMQILETKAFNLIFLDVDMPGMSGFELCANLRKMPQHKATPVVFVTGLTDFESRANSTLSGGNDLIAKPFVFMELAVKAIVFILRARLSPARQ